MKKFLLISVLSITLASCKDTGISQFSWLEGKWLGTVDGAETFEEWQPANGTIMLGHGGAVVGKDTVFYESLKIEQRGDELFYIPTMAENSGAVDFKFTGLKNDSIVFENPQHDFPQRIIYFQQAAGKLYACIDGIDQGKYSRMEFIYTKAK